MRKFRFSGAGAPPDIYMSPPECFVIYQLFRCLLPFHSLFTACVLLYALIYGYVLAVGLKIGLVLWITLFGYGLVLFYYCINNSVVIIALPARVFWGIYSLFIGFVGMICPLCLGVVSLGRVFNSAYTYKKRVCFVSIRALQASVDGEIRQIVIFCELFEV